VAQLGHLQIFIIGNGIPFELVEVGAHCGVVG